MAVNRVEEKEAAGEASVKLRGAMERGKELFLLCGCDSERAHLPVEMASLQTQ